MKKNNLDTSLVLKNGYGNHFGFSDDGSWWASASPGLLHVWNQFNLVQSHEIPGFERGNIIFKNDELIQIGLFEINFRTGEKIYLNKVAELFALGCKKGKSAHYSQYKIREVWNFELEDFVLVSVGYQPSKKYLSKKNFDGPTNRLLLFNRNEASLLKIIAENYDGHFYNNLALASGHVIFTEDEDTCISTPITEMVNKVHSVPGFVPLQIVANNSLAGSYNNSFIQLRNAPGLELIWQLPVSFEYINQVGSYGPLILAGINNNLLQQWSITARSATPEHQISFTGVIEGVAANRQGTVFVALAEKENCIHVLPVE